MPSHEVVVVGAGMAGLTCAVELTRRGVDTVVLERSDAVGGRIRTDRVDGMLLDRGFQLLNPAYPALAGLVDLKALDLKGFGAGVVVASKGERSLLADPRRTVPDFGGLLDQSTGSLREKLRFGLYAARTALGDGSHLTQRLDVAYGEALSSHHIDGRLRSAVLEPFLAGVLAEDVQESSRVFVDLLLRMFVRGTPSLPAAGMQSLPEQVAAQLPSGSVHLGSEVTAVGPGEVTAGGASWRAGAVVVATDAVVASGLLGAAYRPMRALTTFYFRAEHSPAARPFLHVDGDRNGPIVNTAVVSDVAPAYCRDGALVAATVLGSSDGGETQQAVIDQLGRIYGVEAGGWDLVRPYRIVHALPVMLPPLDLREPVELHNGLFVAGDHRDTASIQGAIVSGRRAARAVRSRLRRSQSGGRDLPAV